MIEALRRRPSLAVLVAVAAELAVVPLKVARKTLAGGDVGLFGAEDEPA